MVSIYLTTKSGLLRERIFGQQALVSLLIALLAATLYLASNPHWYGDSVWYALDLRAGQIVADPGHLLWHPLGYSVAALLGLEQNPLLALQILSSIAAVTLVCAGYKLAIQLRLTQAVAFGAAALIAVSHSVMAYAGSGSSYTASAAAITLAICSALNSKNSFKTDLITAALMAISWGFWGTTLLVFPAVVVAAMLNDNGNFRSSVVSAASISFFAVLFTTMLAVSGWSLLSDQTNFVSWLQQSSHGIPADLNLMNFARAVLGVGLSFVYLDELGRAVKSILLSNGISTPTSLILTIISGLTILLSTFVLCGYSMVSKKPQQYRVYALTTAAILPVFAFAAIWQGSDVERFIVVLPFIAIAVATTLDRISPKLSTYLAVALFIHHAVTLIFPAYLPNHKTGSLIRSESFENAILVTHGQQFGPSLWAPLEYFHGTSVHSIIYDVQSNGVHNWEARLKQQISDSGYRPVIVLDGLTSGSSAEIDLSEYPEPSIDQVKLELGNHRALKRFKVGPHWFVQVQRRVE